MDITSKNVLAYPYRSVFLLARPVLAQVKNEQPNIMIIMTDQQAWKAVGYSGNIHIKSPNPDRPVNQGANFSQAVTRGPIKS